MTANTLRFCTSIFVVALFCSYTHSDNRLIIPSGEEDKDFTCRVSGDKDAVRFFFVDEAQRHEGEIKWNINRSGAAEYSWLVYIDHKHTENNELFEGLDLGARYHIDNNGPRRGTLDELLKESEVFSFRYSRNGFFIPEYFEQEELRAEIIDSDLVLTLTRSEKTSFIFDAFPGMAYFWVIIQGKDLRKCRAKVPNLEGSGAVQGVGS